MNPTPAGKPGRFGEHPDGPFVARILEYRDLYRAGRVKGIQYAITVVQTLTIAQAVLSFADYCGVLVALDPPGRN